jgi:hypothetical protein
MEAVQQNLVVMGEADCCAPEPFEDVRGRAERHDADRGAGVQAAAGLITATLLAAFSPQRGG